jgi:hypothetical protein
MPTQTDNLNLYQPDPGESGVADELNMNWEIIDNRFDDARGHLHDGKPGNAPKIPVTSIGASGVPSSSTYLRGDGSWQPGTADGGDVTWDEITGKPATYPSDWDTTIDKPATFPSDWNTTANKPPTFPPSTHTHPASDITGIVDGAFVPIYVSIWSSITQADATFTWTLTELSAITAPIRAVGLAVYGVCPTAGARLQIYNATYTMSRVYLAANSLAATPSYAQGLVLLPANRTVTINIVGTWTTCYLAIFAYVQGAPL